MNFARIAPINSLYFEEKVASGLVIKLNEAVRMLMLEYMRQLKWEVTE